MTSTTSSSAQRYRRGLVSHALPSEARRLQLQEQVMDPQTIRLLTRHELPAAARCLELGAGAGSIARWMAARWPDGQVMATDVDLDLLEGTAAANLTVRRHDVEHDDFPPCSFDLIHARALFVHLAERDAVLAKVVTWLTPGGWLVVEEPCMFPIDSSPYPAFRRVMRAFRRGMEDRGFATGWARGLPAVLAAAGLVDVGAEVCPQHVGMGGPVEEYWRIFLTQAGPALAARGLLTEAQLAAGLDLFGAASFVDVAQAPVGTWGRKPIRLPGNAHEGGRMT